ncbi:hypothetical protein [Methylobacterium sp. ID0610]|uniref:hypothetical protein n=1 Tax=Methylobacterium carpenticola TaxID=3344827 RepID=UPI0036878634
MPRGPHYDHERAQASTTAELRAAGITTMHVYCQRIGCGHEAVIATDRFPDWLTTDQYASRLRCSRCGARRPEVRRDMLAHYASAHAETGWGMGSAGPLPASYKVVGRDLPWPDRQE